MELLWDSSRSISQRAHFTRIHAVALRSVAMTKRFFARSGVLRKLSRQTCKRSHASARYKTHAPYVSSVGGRAKGSPSLRTRSTSPAQPPLSIAGVEPSQLCQWKSESKRTSGTREPASSCSPSRRRTSVAWPRGGFVGTHLWLSSEQRSAAPSKLLR